MMLADFVAPFIAVGLAELGDKTQLALVLLASKTKSRASILAGAFFGFLLVDGVAILLGSWVSDVVPEYLIRYGSAALFIFFGALMLLKSPHEESIGSVGGKPFISSFIIVAATEFGDKTQLAAGLFATQYPPLTVLVSTMAALTLLSAVAVALGGAIYSRIDPAKTVKIAGVVFVSIGLSFLIL